jgi:TPR repeat protein
LISAAWSARLMLLASLLLSGPVSVLAQTVDSGTRLAVVIGNGAYPAAPLANPRNDARAVTGALRELGFKVARVEDATRADFKLLVEGLSQTLAPNSVVLFYFAGHAVQYQGQNFLLPVDFALQRPEDLPGTSLELGEVLQAMQHARVGMTVVVLDACRDYPFGSLAEAFGDGLANIATSGETLVAYATAAGQVALDGTGPNSPYTSALIAALELPGRDLYDVFRTVRAKVREATNGQQLPWITGSVETALVLRQERHAPAGAPPGIIQASYDPAQVHWTTIAASNDPGDFLRFVKAHPQAAAVDQARARERELIMDGVEAIPPLAVATEVLPAPVGRSIAVTACDRWATDPEDPQRVTDGIESGLVNTRQAIRDCAIALAADPANPRLAFMLGRALDLAERFAEAETYYRQAAQEGYAAALYNLGLMYRTGRGVPADDQVAAGFYFDSVMQGSLNARKALASLYEHGWGVPQSDAEMLRWLNLAAADGHARSLDYLGTLYRTGRAVPQDHEHAFRLYNIAAGLENPNALANLARLYREGKGAPKDMTRAIELYDQATRLGNAFAPYHLSQIYRDGDGVVPDPARAEKLLELSADRGYEWAFWRRARWHEEEGDLAAALYDYLLAIEAGRALNHPSGEQLAAEAREKAEVLRSKLAADTVVAVDARAKTWLAQNSLLKNALIYPY